MRRSYPTTPNKEKNKKTKQNKKAWNQAMPQRKRRGRGRESVYVRKRERGEIESFSTVRTWKTVIFDKKRALLFSGSTTP